MKNLFILVLLLCCSLPAMAQSNWYVGTSGGWGVQTYGTVGECDGTTSAAYPDTAYPMWAPNTAYSVGAYVVDFNANLQQVTVAGTSANQYPPSWNTSGTTTDNGVTWTYQRAMAKSQHCALRHPYFLVNQNSPNAWIIAGGDIIHFLDVGPYYIGQGPHNGYGVYFDNSNCLGNAAGCTFPAFPSNVTILGANAGSCHNAGHTGLVNPTVLSGINDAFSVVSFQGTTGDTMSCIEITQPDTCTVAADAALGYAGQCVGGTNNFVGGGGGGGLVMEYGSSAAGPTNLTLQDVAVVGIAASGVLGSHLSGTNTFSDIYVIGNGEAGWNGDGGGCTTGCESTGTMNLSYATIDWNGCVAVKPYVDASGSIGNAYNYCYDDSNGGYGDGFVQVAAGNFTLNVTHSHFRWNTQDGFDSLHLGDDLTTNPITNVSTSWSEGNEGQTFKLGAGASDSAINNNSIGNCRVLQTASNFPLNPAGWNNGLSDFCRAASDQWAFNFKNGETITVQDNTSTGYGATMYDLECVAGGTCTSTTVMLFQGNLSKGYLDPVTGVQAAGLYFGLPDPFSNAGSVISYNLWNTMKSGTCPQDAAETHFLCTDPLLASESNINAINPNLTSGSPARAGGITISGITTDFNGVTRPSPPAIGAFEYVTVAAPTGLYVSPGIYISPGVSIQ